MKIKFFLVGSCYSGYMFKEKLLGSSNCNNMELVFQHQHDSLISIMTDPIDIEVLGEKSKYQWDFNHFAETVFKKNIFDKLLELKPDYLVLDNYVEIKCPLIKVNDKTFLTKNYYIESSTLYDRFKHCELIDVFDANRIGMYDFYAKQFVDRVKKELPEIKFIIVKARAATTLRKDNGERVVFKDVEKLRKENSLRKIYDKKLEKLTGAAVLDMTDCGYSADARIKEQYDYDISSNHYDARYYIEEYGRLKNIVIQDFLGGEKETSKYFNQAVVILLKNDFKMAYLQCRIYKDFFKVYVCIDRKKLGDVFSYEDVDALEALPNVYVISDYNLTGGSYSELVAVMEATEMAFEGDGVECVHFVLDNDIPIIPINKLYNYYCENKNKSFLNLFADGDRNEMRKVEDNIFRYYYFDEDSHDDDMAKRISFNIEEQKERGLYREEIGGFTELYNGVFGGTISKSAYEYCVEYIGKCSKYMEDIKYIRQKVEFFFHTILFNSKDFHDKIFWGKRGGKHAWEWDSKKNFYKIADDAEYEKFKKDPFYFFLRGVTSSNPLFVNKILKDIKSPYRLNT